MMSRPRIALVGARRVRQGLGPFVARQLMDAGAEPVACLGTSRASAMEAAAAIGRDCGIELLGSADWAELIERGRPDAVAILCPPEAHGTYLERALEAGLHTLVEKPLLWSDDPDADARAAAGWVRRFRERGLLLVENCQWPEVLSGIRAMEPGLLPAAQSFAMGLEPAVAGERMLGDALPHPLSLLESLAPGPAALAGIRCRWGPELRSLDLDFRWTGRERSLEAHIELRCSQETPRRAWIQLDALRFDRLVRASDYALFLNCGDRMQRLDDPLERHLANFVETLNAVLGGAAPPDPAPIAARAHALTLLRHAAHTSLP